MALERALPPRWNRSFLALVMVVLGVLTAPSIVLAGDEPPARRTDAPAASISTADYLPADLEVVVVARAGDRLLDTFRSALESRGFFESSAYALAARDPGFMAGLVGLRGVAASAGLDAWSAVGASLGRETAIALSIRPGRPPRAIAVALPRDSAAVDRLLKVVLSLAGIQTGDDLDAEGEKIEGHRAWKLKQDAWICRTDDAVLFASHRALLARGLQAHKARAGRLTDSEEFQSAARSVPKDALVWAQVDLSSLRKRFGKNEAAYPAQISNPLGGFVFGGWWHAIRNGERGVAWVTGNLREVTFATRIASDTPLPDTHRGFSKPPKTGAPWRAEDLPGYLSEMRVSRDWANLFAERETLLTLPAAGDLVNFSNTFTTLMGGLDFVDDFLSKVNGPIRFIAARQDFSTRGFVPSPKLPAFALVIVGSSRVDLQACKLEYSIVSPK